MNRFNLDGEVIEVAKCDTCGHEIDITTFQNCCHVNGLDCDNVLVILDAVQSYFNRGGLWNGCCKNPNYYLTEKRKWFNTQ